MNTAKPTTPADAPSGWSGQSLDRVHDRVDKADRVRGMFSSIARSYDLNNRLHSFGLDQAWRRRVVRDANVRPTDRVLDVACGTGDLAIAFAQRSPAAKVVGLDYTPAMLDIARHKGASRPDTSDVEFIEGDAQNLPFDDASFDVCTIAFGIRNVQDTDAALREFRRVLAPGGRLLILEFDRPSFAPIRWGNDFYCKRVMPLTATLISRDHSGAYRYLPSSVDQYLGRERLAQHVHDTGFGDVTNTPLTFGVCVITRAVVPS